MPRQSPPLPLPVQRALHRLGEDIRDVRRRRRLTMEIVAERARIDRATLGRLERGAAGVSLGVCATVLYVLGMIDRLSALAAAEADAVGLMLEQERLPQRVRMPSAEHRTGDGSPGQPHPPGEERS